MTIESFYDVYEDERISEIIIVDDASDIEIYEDLKSMTDAFPNRYFETFISIPGIDHIDHELSKEGGEFIVCNPFPFTQYSGISSNTGKFEDYNELFKFRNLFIGKI